MKKELLEKIKRVIEEVGKRFLGTGSYSYGTETVDICIWDGGFTYTCTFKISMFEKYSIDMCARIIVEALTDDDYVSIRPIGEIEYKAIDMLKDNCIDDEEVYWIDYIDGMLNIKDSEDNEWYEIDLTDCELVKVVEPTVEQEMELHIKYDDLMFIIKEVEGEAVCKVSEADEDTEEEFDKDEYIKELEQLVAKQSKLIKLLRENQEKLMKMNKLI